MSDAPDLQETLERVTECIEQHDKTGYSGVLKWAELKDIRTLLKAQQAENLTLRISVTIAERIIAELEAENARLKEAAQLRYADGFRDGSAFTEGSRHHEL